MSDLESRGRQIRPYCWSLAWVRQRIAAHRTASAAATQYHVQRFHAQQADLWESYLLAFRAARGRLNVRVLDWYKPPPV